MGNQLPKSKTKKTLMGAVGAGILAGAATMFIPTGVMEAITGATGLSELVPATAAPLGDKARALIAFGTGALTLAIAAIILLRKDEAIDTEKVSVRVQAPKPSGTDSLADRLAGVKERLPRIKLPKMPWIKGDNEVRDLSDLPSIRSADAHPDAPARRPLLATKDLPLNAGAPREINTQPSSAISVAERAPFQVEPTEFRPALQVEDATASIPTAFVPSAIDTTLAKEPIIPEASFAAAGNLGCKSPKLHSNPMASELSIMLDQFEAAIGRRRVQLSALANSGTQPSLSEQAPVAGHRQEGDVEAKVSVEALFEAPVETAVETTASVRPSLEVVPDSPNGDVQEMDVALNAALATLHRMNAQAR